MKSVPSFPAGFAAGLAICWAYIGSLKATIKLYETYIHERIDAMVKNGQRDQGPAPASSYTQTAKVASGQP